MVMDDLTMREKEMEQNLKTVEDRVGRRGVQMGGRLR